MPGLIDKIALLKSKIRKETRISGSFVVFETENEATPLVLKFSYSGNTQYHRLSSSEIEALRALLNTFEDNRS